ncbi:SusD/RagB family nutrient-binding outer membrane lipoprotein [Hymenobacter latericus]|uniref:SusD/RagB family nutrient-binding outer membrane lipoprotein n=1 Tax=Hymenobacter sp. YIM 151858-1 TaxID=2987688 RepID=UPI00222715FE|nr:SusD/RagB family nutrient-binding outer membrane lipoprotein [Hymenobacter sp. YIM 151858-1]UYZ59231.1 SusD/RagB family nutrient-binding outer membrane lipoprotein [Hymenobacter sp. YIM 151858-1]
MKKLLLFCIPALLFTTSCVDSLEDDYNVNPKAATKVPGVTLVSNAQRSLARTMVSGSVNLNVFRLYVQQWAQTTYFDESTYDINTRNINGSFWNAMYRDVLRDLLEAKRLIQADNTLSPKVKANQLASIEVLEVYAWSTLVNTFGDVPYTEALDFAKSQPKYDDDKAIYNDLINRLNTAIGQFDASAAGLGDGDLLYHGDVSHWVMFANSLKLRMGMTIADDDAAKAKTLVEQAAGKVFKSNDDNAQVTFLSTPPSTNPLWEDLVQSGRKDFVGTSLFVGTLTSLKDPRLDEYFKPLANGSYRGGVYGVNNSSTNFSNPGPALEDPTLPGALMSYAQVEFLLADAASRGFNVGGTVESHYNAGITASILQWGNTQAEAAAYLLQPEVAFATATGTAKEKIGRQEWIALYGQPVDAWTEFRRLDSPKLTAPTGARSALPLRFPYPIAEQNVNGANYASAASAIGGDVVTTKIFWDKN